MGIYWFQILQKPPAKNVKSATANLALLCRLVQLVGWVIVSTLIIFVREKPALIQTAKYALVHSNALYAKLDIINMMGYADMEHPSCANMP